MLTEALQAVLMLYVCRRLQALDAYSDQMQRRDEEIDVLECALLIAKHAHPDLVTIAMVLLLRGQQVHSVSTVIGVILRFVGTECSLLQTHRMEVRAAARLRAWHAACVRRCHLTQCHCVSCRWGWA